MNTARTPAPRLLAICAAPTARLAGRVQGRPASVVSGIRKQVLSSLDKPAEIEFNRLGVLGDQQADLSVHGGPDKAVYMYPFAHYAQWAARAQAAGVPFDGAPGAMGENLLVEGLDEHSVWVGDRIRIGGIELQVTLPRRPCYKFDLYRGYDGAGREMVLAGQTGWYCEVIRPGSATAGQALLGRPGSRSDTIFDMHCRMHRMPRGTRRTGVN